MGRCYTPATTRTRSTACRPRARSPSPDGSTACAEVRALAEVYALLVYDREPLADEHTMPERARVPPGKNSEW